MKNISQVAHELYGDALILKRLKRLRNSLLLVIVIMWLALAYFQDYHPVSLDIWFTGKLSGKLCTVYWGCPSIFTLALGFWITKIQQRINYYLHGTLIPKDD